MFPDYYYFLSNRPSTDPNYYALLGDDSRSNISGRGTAVFTMNGRLVLVHNTLHIPSLWAPLYSTQCRRTQPGCTYYNDDTFGNVLLFTTMVINRDSTTDNIVSFRPIDRTLRDRKLDYVEPRPDSSRLTKMSLKIISALIPTQTPTKDPNPDPSATPPSKHPMPAPLTAPTKVDTVSLSKIAKMHLHDMPDIRPCNTRSPSDTRQSFGPLKLHQIFGCCRFRNPKHITSAADNATPIKNGEPPTTLGAFTTTPKSK